MNFSSFDWVTYRPKISFLAIHYTYILATILAGAVIIYGHRNLPFIDALFFSSGAATQSGLNTIDVNLLHRYQQVIIYIVSLITNPIFINSAIVFVRIRWFEKKLATLVEESRLKRGHDMRGRPIHTDNLDPDVEERGVGGRPITVVHHPPPESIQDILLVNLPSVTNGTPQNADGTAIPPRVTSDAPQERSGDGSGDVSSTDQVSPSDVESASDNEEDVDPHNTNGGAGNQENSAPGHIVFADAQVPSKKRSSGVLRIPSPREFERGGKVEDIDEDTQLPLRRIHTTGAISMNDDGGRGNTHTSRIRKRMGSISGRILPRAQTLEATTSGYSRGRSSSPMSRLSRRTTRADPGPMPYLSYHPTVGRNSAFIDLSEEEKNELGGLEYRSLKLLAKILVGYMIFFQIIGILCIMPWIFHKPQYQQVVKAANANSVWWSIFTVNSAFNDLGFTLTPDSMISFQRATWPILFFAFLIIIGNTGFPCMLRLIIWTMKKIVPQDSSLEKPLGYLLDHPRRCFTLLFPAAATWWLFAILVILNLTDLLFFIVLDLNDPDVVSIPIGYRILSGLFQAVATRTAGFAVVNIATLHPAMQVSYVVMMYISIFPIAISVRRTNVYEESALGIYAAEEEVDGKSPSFVGAHLRNQLQYDLWYIFLGLFIISIAEGKRVENNGGNETSFTLFAILFEVVSAYGTVGLSLGYPNTNPSFSGEFTVISKLVIIAMQIRGRHRGLPYQVDRAILLPSEKLLADHRLHRRPSFISPGLPLGRSLSQATNATRARPATADHRE